MTFDATKIAPWTEADSEALEAATRPVTWDMVDILLNKLPAEDKALVVKYVQRLNSDLTKARRRADALDRARYRPGDGDMGG